MLEDGEEARTGRPWSDVLTVESVDTDGTVVVVPARPAEVVLGQLHALLTTRSFPPC